MFPFTELFVFAAIFLLSLWLLSGFLTKKKKKKSGENSPPSIPSIPILGSLPFIAWNADGHIPRYFLKKSEELGPIFTFKVGGRSCLVLNSFEAIEEALVRKSSAFSGRQMVQQEALYYNKERKGIVAGYYNSYWKYHQRLSLSILREFGFGNNNTMDRRISQEVTELVKFIKSMNGRSFDPKDLALHISANIIHQLLFADRTEFSEGIHRFYSLGNEYIDSFIQIIEVAPWLRFLPYFKQMVQRTVAIHKEIFRNIKELVNDVKSGNMVDCFVSRYIEKEALNCDVEQMHFILRDLALAGMDTTATTVLWSLLFLANHQTIQTKLQNEIDEVVPRNRLPTYTDKKSLPYMEAFILEVQRIRTLIPMALPHQTLGDTQIFGFDVPAGTTVLANLYATHMDPKIWKDPENFRPERFLDANSNIINKEKCIPFSLGRRSCLGEVLARQELFLIISGLVQNFVVQPPEKQTVLDEKEKAELFLKPSKYEIRMLYRAE